MVFLYIYIYQPIQKKLSNRGRVPGPGGSGGPLPSMIKITDGFLKVFNS